MDDSGLKKKWKVYPEYKDSGVGWLGEIPSSWKIERLKNIVYLINAKADTDLSLISYIGLEHIESWTGKKIAFIDDNCPNDIQANMYKKGDILFGKLRPYLAKALVAQSGGLCSGELLVLRPKYVQKYFLKNYLLTSKVIAVINSSTYGVKMPRANWGFIGNLPVPLPPSEEQESIKAFLDQKTQKIDRLIEKKRRLIELLKEKRQALITHTVTKGVPAKYAKKMGAPVHTRFKPGEVGWLGEIPSDWKTNKIKYVSLINPESLPENTLSDYEMLYIDIGNVDHVKGVLCKESLIFEDAPSRARKIVKDGDTIVSTVRTYLKAIAYIEKPEHNLIVSTGFAVIQPVKIDKKFISWYCKSNPFIDRVMALSKGVSYPAVNSSQIGTIEIYLPLNTEQSFIANFLDQKTQKIDRLISETDRSIALLKEYRQALITNAVTGKIDVRNHAV